MGLNRTGFYAHVTMAGIALSLVLAGCASRPGTDPAAAAPRSTTGATAGAAPTVTATPTATPAPVAPTASAAPPVAAPAPSAKPAAPARKTFTFPDGHISFTYPSTWTVRTVLPPARTVPGVEAIVSDGAGNDLLSLQNGFTTGCAAAPTSREVFDKVQAPGMTAPGGTKPVFGFAVESSSTRDFYGMGLRDPRYLEQGKGVTSSCGLLATGNGGLTTSVLFNDPAFPTRAAAKAWMATDQYAQLKALLISLNYV